MKNESDVFDIPPNFIEGGMLFGGSLKLRNAMEAGALVLAVGLPVLRIPPFINRQDNYSMPYGITYGNYCCHWRVW